MHILITGASGTIGSALSTSLTAKGHKVTSMTRPFSSDKAFSWSPEKGQINLPPSASLDAVINLAGESINQRWSPAAKRRIETSRVTATRLLVEQLATLTSPPKVLINGSASGFYGNGGDIGLSENHPKGQGFAAELCDAWEQQALKAEVFGTRVVNIRTAPVMDKHSGMLKQLLPLYRLGLGGEIANGRQWLSWISLSDEIAAIEHCLFTKRLKGPVNLSSPGPLINRDFSVLLAKALNRPALLPVPAFALKLVYGQMAEELLLSSQRLVSTMLLESGFHFQHPTFESFLLQL
jgi:uncharacterized protein (TIGR01777 family)